jgi:hypothetical protein
MHLEGWPQSMGLWPSFETPREKRAASQLDFGQFCLAKRTQFAGVSGASGILDGPRHARDRQEIRPFQYSAAFRALAASKIGQSRAELDFGQF